MNQPPLTNDERVQLRDRLKQRQPRKPQPYLTADDKLLLIRRFIAGTPAYELAKNFNLSLTATKDILHFAQFRGPFVHRKKREGEKS
jgi:hypothetical protein